MSGAKHRAAGVVLCIALLSALQELQGSTPLQDLNATYQAGMTMVQPGLGEITRSSGIKGAGADRLRSSCDDALSSLCSCSSNTRTCSPVSHTQVHGRCRGSRQGPMSARSPRPLIAGLTKGSGALVSKARHLLIRHADGQAATGLPEVAHDLAV